MGGILFLVGTAILAALLHSLVPDHWVPYVVIGRAHHWTRRHSIWMAGVGAMAHLASTAAVGLVMGLFFQGFLRRDGGESVENLTGFLVIGIGAWFLIRGLTRSGRGLTHAEVCGHNERQAHQEDSLFLGAVFGLRPCVEALPIFLLAASRGILAVVLTILGWALASIFGMIGVVYLGFTRLERINLGWLEQHAETLAGGIIILVGLGVFLLGVLYPHP